MTFWQILKSPKTLLIFAGVVFVAALVGVIYGVVNHKEAGLLKVCWREDGQALYVKGAETNVGQCASPEEIKWDRVPLVVDIREYSGIPTTVEAYDAVSSAIDTANAQLGPVFALSDNADSAADVVVYWGVPYDSGNQSPPGECTHRRIDNRLVAEIIMRATGNNRLSYRVLLHELGHALGLAHDSFEASIMYSLVLDDTWDDRMSYDRFTDDDRRLIKELYAR